MQAQTNQATLISCNRIPVAHNPGVSRNPKGRALGTMVCVCVMFVWRIFAANPYSIMLFYTIVRVNKTVGN